MPKRVTKPKKQLPITERAVKALKALGIEAQCVRVKSTEEDTAPLYRLSVGSEGRVHLGRLGCATDIHGITYFTEQSLEERWVPQWEEEAL